MNVAMPAPQMIASNGISLGVYQAGAENTALPPLILCHGFPELAFSWRHQLSDLPRHPACPPGLRVIAPDQRGYGLTVGPDSVEAYDLEHLCGDLVGLLDAFSIEKAVFCGHDWGGLVVWAMAVRHPDRVAGVIGLNTPYTKRASIDPMALYRQKFGDDFYINYFQKLGVADALLAENVEQTFRYFMRRPDVSAASSGAAPSLPQNLALHHALPAFQAQNDPHQLLDDDELAFFVDTFTCTGFTGAINWYRNFSRNWANSAHLVDHVPHPSLMIMAENDAVLPPAAANGMEKYVPNLSRVLINGSGHWTQQEKPDETSAAIAHWMNNTFNVSKTI